MKNFLFKINSTIFLVLFCFSGAFSLPLSRTVYTLPEEKIDIAFNQELVYIENMNRVDNFVFNLGLPWDTSFGFDFSIIHNDYKKAGSGVPGDILFNLWHFVGDYFDGAVSSGLSIVVRIPTGPDAYVDEKFRNLSYGYSELKFSPVLSFSLSQYEDLIFNLSYTFREGRGEDLYSSLKLNPFNGESYKSVFGLNPCSENSFFEGEKLKNDYASISAGFITSRLHPWIFFSEIYYSSGFYNKNNDTESINIEGNGVNPILLSLGIKYVFSNSFFIQLSDTAPLIQSQGYIKNRVELSLNIFF
jgi:hypothetical protein